MPKRKKLKFKTSKTQVEGAGLILQHRGGEFDPSSLIKFIDDAEEASFNKARDRCVEQNESTNGIDNFMYSDGRTFEDGENVLIKFQQELNGSLRTTLNDIPSISNEEEFLKHAQQDSISLVDADLSQYRTELRDISIHLFELNKEHQNEARFGKMMYLLAILCSRSIHCEHLIEKEQAQRKKLSSKIIAIDQLFKTGLVTGSIWSHSAFWNGVRSQLLLEHDLTSEKSPFSPFHPTFKLLKYFFEDEKFKAPVLDSILHIFNELSVFNKLSGYNQHSDDRAKRHSISDSLGNLPEYVSESGCDFYSYHQ
ncbi:hypothetical protein HQ531_05360 [bacterium]|nr:hypothetical protein [bacterium]